jgi:hypothetical protein
VVIAGKLVVVVVALATIAVCIHMFLAERGQSVTPSSLMGASQESDAP